MAASQAPDRIDVLVTGTIFCDLVFTGVGAPPAGTEVFADAFAVAPGGSANPAVTSARLGRRTAILSELGDDPLGLMLRGMLADEPHLELGWVRERTGFRTPVTAALSGAHDRSFITYAEPHEELAWPACSPAVGVAHVGIFDDTPAWVTRLRSQGTVIVAGAGWDETELWRSSELDRLQCADIFVPNDREAMRYTRTTTPQDAARALGEYVPLAIVTRGKDGALAFDRATGELTDVPTVPVKAVDTAGAGDVFMGAFMSTFDEDWSLRERLQFANLCAALSVQALGGATSAPTPASILRYLSEARPDGDWERITPWVESRHSQPNGDWERITPWVESRHSQEESA